VKRDKKHGVRFKIPNVHGNFLLAIFEFVPTEQYCWSVTEADIVNGECAEELFSLKTYAGEEFAELLPGDPYYIVFWSVLAFSNGAQLPAEPIKTIEEFQQSAARWAVRIVDCTCVSVFAHNDADLEPFRRAAERQGWPVESIPEEDWLKRLTD
jgi:hypothetical protein